MYVRMHIGHACDQVWAGLTFFYKSGAVPGTRVHRDRRVGGFCLLYKLQLRLQNEVACAVSCPNLFG